MKLANIEINKFKSIDSVNFSIDSMPVLIGENNAGKSNIFKAIELFYSDSIRNISDEDFYFKDRSKPISIILTFNQLQDAEKNNSILQSWIYEDEIKIKKVINFDAENNKYNMSINSWRATPEEECFNLDKFNDFKSDIKTIVEQKNLPDYFKTDKGTITQASYKEGIKKHIKNGLVVWGAPGWLFNPEDNKEVLAKLLPRFYLVPADLGAQDESKTTQNTIFGKLVNDLSNRIIEHNPDFVKIKDQLDNLIKYLNKDESGDDLNRLQEIKDLEEDISKIIDETMPGTNVELKFNPPELTNLLKDTEVKIDDSIITSIDSKGHGLQRALIFAYIRAYAKILNTIDDEEQSVKNIILAIEEPELCLHPNGQRKMMQTLSNLAKEHQVLICTHSTFFVNMFEYKNIIIVKRDDTKSTQTFQYTGDIFQSENKAIRKRFAKQFRCLSLFDLSRSEMFFAKKVILVEGDTEKFIMPFWLQRMVNLNKKYDFSANNICIIECGGKFNMHIFMRVLNNFKIPYVAIHDLDPLDFPEDKQDKTDKEEQLLRAFRENDIIKQTLDEDVGKILCINPDLEPIIGVSNSQVVKVGKVQAAFDKYEELDISDFPKEVKQIVDLISDWDKDDSYYELKAQIKD